MKKELTIEDYKSGRTLYLTGEITKSSTADIEESINDIIIDDESKWSDNVASLKLLGEDYSNLYKTKNQFPPIKLIITSQGGSVYYGLGLYDFIRNINLNTQHKINVEINGSAASMATIIMLASDVRTCGKNCSFMVHSISSLTYGKIEELKDDVKETERLNTIIKSIYKERTNIDDALLNKIEKEKLDYWMSADEALKLGLVTNIG